MGYYYLVIRASIKADGDLEIVGKRKQVYISSARLNVGGLYFLKPHKLYKILSIEEVSE